MSPLVARLVAVAPALSLLAAAIVTDVRSRRIPNWLNATLAITGVSFAGLEGGLWPALGAVGAAAIGLALLYLPFAAGVMGGGDVKLAAAAGAWVGLSNVLPLLLYSAVVGGVLSVVYYLRASASERAAVRSNVATALTSPSDAPARMQVRGRGIPYGVAIALVAAVLIVRGS